MIYRLPDCGRLGRCLFITCAAGLLGPLSITARALAQGGNAEATVPAEMKAYTAKFTADDETIHFEVVPIAGGKVVMGSPAGEEDREDDEGPRVEVTIEPFWMAKYEVTWELYDPFINEYNLHFSGSTKFVKTTEPDLDAISFPTPLYEPGFTFELGHEPKEPAVTMTHFAARQFTKWLSLKTGHIYRLPSEAEWEYACRAGTQTAYSFGDDVDDLDDYGWYYDNADDKYQDVGQKKPNPWGLYDMHGNVAEWVLDKYDPERYGKLASRAPVSAADAIAWPDDFYPNVVRGGSWDDDPDGLRSAARMTSTSDWSKQDPQIPNSIWWHTDSRFAGFRMVRPLKQPSKDDLKKCWEPVQEMTRDILDIGDRQIRVKLPGAKPIPGWTANG